MSVAARVGGPDKAPPSQRHAASLLQGEIIRRALRDSFAKLDPHMQVRNPVMFVVEIGAVVTTVTWLIQVFGGGPLGGGNEPAWHTFTISVWLWLTVVFANLAEAFAEGRGRAQADALRSTRHETVAILRDGSTRPAAELTKGDVVVVEAGELIPGDGTVIVLMGAPEQRSAWRRLTSPPLPARLLSALPGVDLRIVADRTQRAPARQP